jgi:hypothetical protein
MAKHKSTNNFLRCKQEMAQTNHALRNVASVPEISCVVHEMLQQWSLHAKKQCHISIRAA